VLSEADYYRAMAARCAQLAEEAAAEDARARFLSLQQRWLQHAAEADAEAGEVKAAAE
jgi:hypothetical protein